VSKQDGVIRQQVIEELMRQIMHYDAEFRRGLRNRLSREALTAVSDRVAQRIKFDPTPILDRPGVIGRAALAAGKGIRRIAHT
jgi:hypothetical protein